uniref:Retrovirus-related Pol polyprotein from transposon gypsy n=1 Tax=Ceratitis capitata TaxID=7213 RepID=W8AXM5_CERCA
MFNDDDINTVHSAETDSTYFIKITENAINIFKNQLILQGAQRQTITKRILYKKKIRNTINVTPESDILKLKQENLPEKGLVVVYCPDDKLFLQFQELDIKFFANNAKLKIMKSNIILRDITDKGELLTLLEDKHLENNHRGINETTEEIRKTQYYPKLKKEIQKYTNKAKSDRNPIKHSLNITDTPKKHNEIVHFDIWYPQRGVMYLTSIDKLTKYATAKSLKDRTWISIINAIKERIQYLGKPETLVTDNELDTVLIKQFLKDNKINLHLTTTYNKTGNSDVERLHSTLNEHLRIFNADGNNNDNLKEKVFKAITAYDNTLHSTIKKRPIDLRNNLLPEQELIKFAETLQKQREDIINNINRKENRVDTQDFQNKYIKNYINSKTQPKYKKISNYTREGNHLISKDNKFRKAYKNQIKRKFKFQDHNGENHDNSSNYNDN